MFNGEKPREEVDVAIVVEEEKKPEQVVNNAVSAVENRDAADPVISSKWGKAAQEFFSLKENLSDAKAVGRGTFNALRIGLFTALFKVPYGILKFAKKAIEKKGNISFKEGFEIGEDSLSFPDKKEKK